MTAPTITLTRDGRAVLAFPFDAAFIESLKATVPGYARVYDPAVKTWTIAPAYADVAARLPCSASMPRLMRSGRCRDATL